MTDVREPLNDEVFNALREEGLGKELNLGSTIVLAMCVSRGMGVIQALTDIRQLMNGMEEVPLYAAADAAAVLLAMALKDGTEVLDSILLLDNERKDLKHKPAEDIEGKC